MNNELSHFDAAGNAIMVDISQKSETSRKAVATGKIKMNNASFSALQSGSIKKGDVLGVARIAGIMALKRTSDLIPLCHPLPVTKAGIDFELLHEERAIKVICTVTTQGKTGVEMEALVGANMALLTICDMCKAVDKSMEMYDIFLLSKEGGKSGAYIKDSGV